MMSSLCEETFGELLSACFSLPLLLGKRSFGYGFLVILEPHNANGLGNAPNLAESSIISGSKRRSALLPSDYFRIRDFEYAQPLYDLAYLLEVDAIAKGLEVPKYRTFSLWRAAYSLDGYSTTIDRWLDGNLADSGLDYVPSNRIRKYLSDIRTSGTIPELRQYSSSQYERVLRLRAVRGLGVSQAVKILSEGDPPSEHWLNDAAAAAQIPRAELLGAVTGAYGTWQSAHIVPPLLRLLCDFEQTGISISSIDNLLDGIRPVTQPFVVKVLGDCRPAIEAVLGDQPSFRVKHGASDGLFVQHQLGWYFLIQFQTISAEFSLSAWAKANDPLLTKGLRLKGDLHLHTSWSDGNASLADMAQAVKESGLEYCAITDHSRSCKLQGGLTPAAWLRQAASISLNSLTCPILHGIEVDILEDGSLDLPDGLLSGMDIVVASVHSSWTADEHVNTQRLLNAIESGQIDIIGHPTAAVIGKPGVPDYVRKPAKVDWGRVFEFCARWMVALEVNCFPSRLDLSVDMVERAIQAGCWISLGSDSHSRSHLAHLRFGQAMVENLDQECVLNRLSLEELRQWLATARSIRSQLPRTKMISAQAELFVEAVSQSSTANINAFLNPPQRIPHGSAVIGIDLTAGTAKPTGVALLREMEVETCSLETDEELLAFVQQNHPAIVSIDSPLGFPGGGAEINPVAGIVRVAEHDLSSVGIPAYPALIDSMKELTIRGVRLRKRIEALENPPVVIESYPGAAQDVLCIPRKQKSLELLRTGLRELGIEGPGLLTESHDEMDAITSAIVGRFYERGEFLPMGIRSEAQLIVPRVKPLRLDPAPVICLAGRTGAGKSVVARYLALFYGFEWIRTRDLIRELLIKNIPSEPALRACSKQACSEIVSDEDVRNFGLLILEKHSQEPLRHLLMQRIYSHVSPIVVDSIRDVTDIDTKAIGRPVFVWFIDCNDQAIFHRLTNKRSIASFRDRPTINPIDQNVSTLNELCDTIIPNMGSLEELRWKIDDHLFQLIDFCAPAS